MDVIDVSNPTSPSLVGTAQLTIAPGQSPPPGVLPAPGTPTGVVLSDNKEAVVAINGVGLVAVDIPATVPPDASNPGGAIRRRYPASGLESITAATLLTDRVLTTGAAGLTTLDAATFERRGGTAITGEAIGLAALPAFAFDVNGDGAITSVEVFDIGAVVTGADGTLHLYNVPLVGNPALLSVVRFGSAANGIVVDADERLAYVALGSHGLAIVDLDGPASVQPLDNDRDGLDDRILGILDTPGTSERLAPALERGLMFVADGAAGLSVIQVLPPRTKFLSLSRDPVIGTPGDEEDITTTRRALLSDDAIRVRLNAVVPPTEDVVLVLEEDMQPPVLRFIDGSTVQRLNNGLNDLLIPLLGSPGSAQRAVTLHIQTTRGVTIGSLALHLASASLLPSITGLYVSPGSVRLGVNNPSVQLSVGAALADGQLVNVTDQESGTRYFTENPSVAVVSADGLVTALAGGTSRVFVLNGPAMAAMVVHVDLPVVLTSFEVPRPRLTLTVAGQQHTLDLRARFSDNTILQGADGLGTVFETSDSNVVTVDSAGRITVVGEGFAIVTARNGSAVAEFEVAVEFRVPAVLSAITLAAVVPQASVDDEYVRVLASLAGPVLWKGSGSPSRCQVLSPTRSSARPGMTATRSV